MMSLVSIALLLALFHSLSKCSHTSGYKFNESSIYCPHFKNSPPLNVQDLVGSWLTVYTHPKSINCFTLHIRATTDLEREQYVIKYGNFSGRVNWDICLLEVESPLGKHFLQGTGKQAGLLENIIISQASKDEYVLQDEPADQWTVYGRRGSEVLMMRDCTGTASAAFARAPYWPTVDDLYAILHRSGVAPVGQGRVLCEPKNVPTVGQIYSHYFARQ